MKKRFLAALVAVTMVVSVFVGFTASAGYEKTGEALVTWDMEDSQPAAGGFGTAMTVEETAGVDGSKCLKTPGSGGWAVCPLGTKLFTTEKNKNYIVSVWFKGPLYQAIVWVGNEHSGSDMKVERVGAPEAIDWTELTINVKTDSAQNIGLNFQEGGAACYIDNISIYEATEVADPTPEPAPVEPEKTEAPAPVVTNAPVDGTPAATTAPVVGTPVATVAPTAAATATATPVVTPPAPKKVKISFKKKNVKIKKGKKVTLKVTLKNAKKAKFSVDKKGKKVVKLSKKKAKSVVVKGKKKGKATITAKAGNKKATCKVKVK